MGGLAAGRRLSLRYYAFRQGHVRRPQLLRLRIV
jgi:hypothetical protein